MSSRLTERRQEIEARRFIFGCYARSFSPPRIQQLCDALVGLDRLGACRLASDIDQALGSVATEKILSQLETAAASAITREGRKAARKKG